MGYLNPVFSRLIADAPPEIYLVTSYCFSLRLALPYKRSKMSEALIDSFCLHPLTLGPSLLLNSLVAAELILILDSYLAANASVDRIALLAVPDVLFTGPAALIEH
uniref:Uncharacterized protein n=1 Tax=Opuntia streptacantha TaxID=393608 RepID=A0A7C9DNT0_OPUST